MQYHRNSLSSSASWREGAISVPKGFHLRAFTLIELLVVITIIGILAALLLPSLHRSMEQGRSLACLNGQKQLQFCWLLYAEDNNGELAPNNYSYGVGLGSTGYQQVPGMDSWCPGDARRDQDTSNLEKGVLWEYNQTASIYRCPSDFSKIVTKSGSKISKLRVRSVNMSIWLNCSANTNSESRNLSIKTLAGIHDPQPSKFFVFIDTHEEAIADPTFGIYPAGHAWGDYWVDLPADRHNKGANISFADGHVEHWRWRSAKKFYSWGQPTINAEDRKDLRRLQACIPPLNSTD